MSFHFWLYRAPPGLGPFTQWQAMQAERLGSQHEVCMALSEVLQSVKWISYKDKHTFGEAVDSRYKCSYFLSLHEHEVGSVSFITTSNHASPFTLSAIMDRLSQNYCCTDFGDFRHPHVCDDNWKVVEK